MKFYKQIKVPNFSNKGRIRTDYLMGFLYCYGKGVTSLVEGDLLTIVNYKSKVDMLWICLFLEKNEYDYELVD